MTPMTPSQNHPSFLNHPRTHSSNLDRLWKHIHRRWRSPSPKASRNKKTAQKWCRKRSRKKDQCWGSSPSTPSSTNSAKMSLTTLNKRTRILLRCFLKGWTTKYFNIWSWSKTGRNRQRSRLTCRIWLSKAIWRWGDPSSNPSTKLRNKRSLQVILEITMGLGSRWWKKWGSKISPRDLGNRKLAGTLRSRPISKQPSPWRTTPGPNHENKRKNKAQHRRRKKRNSQLKNCSNITQKIQR